MARRASAPTPPLLAYIESSQVEQRHASRRKDAEAAIGRLYREQAELIAANHAAPAEIAAANAEVVQIAGEVAEIEAAVAEEMEAGGRVQHRRQSLADARSRLVETRSNLDQLTRFAAERARRLTAIAADIESWENRRETAALALMAIRSPT